MDILLNESTHDIEVNEFTFSLVSEIDEIVQNVKIRLLFFKGEWFLDTTVGLPFYDEIFVKNPDVSNVDNIFKAQILDTPGVISLLEYESTFINAERKFQLSFTINTIYGETTISEVTI